MSGSDGTDPAKYLISMRAMLLTSLIFVLSCCNKADLCIRYVEIESKICENKLEFQVGDTIHFESSFSKFVKGFNSNEEEVKEVDMNGIHWQPVLHIRKLDTIVTERLSTINRYFDFIEDSSYNFSMRYVDNSSQIEGEYNEADLKFDLKAKIVALKPGLYFADFGSTVNTYLPLDQSFEGCCNKCRNGFDVWTRMISPDSTNNSQLLFNSPSEVYNTWITNQLEDRFYKIGGVCFEVKN